jgi:hypothetical protein
MKKCSKCPAEYPATAEYFYRNKRTKDGFRPDCKKCCNKVVKKYAQTEKGKAVHRLALKKYRQSRKGKHADREDKLKRRFGLTLKDYDQMLEAQDGVCAVCGNPETYKQNGICVRLSIDHNHNTGLVRGLLCRACNVVLGLIDENKERLLELALYLEKHNG